MIYCEESIQKVETMSPAIKHIVAQLGLQIIELLHFKYLMEQQKASLPHFSLIVDCVQQH